RRCYCSSSALFLFFSGCWRQGRVIQHSAVAGNPRCVGSCAWRQCLVAVGRPACRCDCSAPGVSDSRGPVHVALSFAFSSPSEFSLPRRLRAIAPSFEVCECFIVAFLLKIMRQSRIDWLRKRCLQLVDLFRHCAQSCDVFCLVAAAFLVTNDRETFSQRLS